MSRRASARSTKMRLPRRGNVLVATLLLCACCLPLVSCSMSDAVNVARVARGDPGGAVDMAKNRAVRYASNPNAILTDYRRFKRILNAFRNAVSGKWGQGDAREAKPKEYVKYTDNYLSRASVDFEAGRITIETLDQDAPVKRLREAIVTTVLTPYDPRAVDMFSSGPVKLGGTPFLLGEVKDQAGRDIRTERQAEDFARRLVSDGVQERTGETGQIIRYVVIEMERDHMYVRAAKFKPMVEAAAKRFDMPRTLIYAVIRVESDFNPYAINTVPAIGLMQVVPQTAGADVQAFLTGRRQEPSKAFLFEPENNITYGAAYLKLLDSRHLSGVRDPVSREYCVIASYNGGAGALLRTFDRNRSRVLTAINAKPPLAVYQTITREHAAKETREYLQKVITAEKLFVGM